MFKKHSKAKSVGPRLHRYYWFTIQSPNGQTLATSETYTTAAMRDKGIEAVKKVVWKNSTAAEVKQWWGEKAWMKSTGVVRGRDLATVLRRPSDTFHIENKKGKIVNR